MRERCFSIPLLVVVLLGSPQASVRGQEFLDIVVSNRFFSGPQSFPTLKVRTKAPLLIDTVIYEAEGKPIAFFPEIGRAHV